MSIRNRLLILLLSVSLIPLAVYFVLDISFSRIVRSRVQKTLRSALEQRARFELVQAINNYDEKLKISGQAVRYGLRHYADQVQRILWSIDIDAEQSSTPPYLVGAPSQDISGEARRYEFLSAYDSRKPTIDFDSQFIHLADSESRRLLAQRLPRLTETCKDIYSIDPETKLWIYTILTDGTVALYPSVGFWPYETGYDLRRRPWYLKARANKQLTLTPRIEPLTGKTVMTVAVPLFEKDSSFAGVIAMDIDLSGILERIQIPQSWQAGAWKLLIRLPEENQWQADDVKVLCCTTFLQSQEGPGKPSSLLDICDPQDIRKMIEDSRRGNAGLLRRPYKGVDSLWAYGSSQRGGGFPILVVPYQRIIEQADNARQMLFRDNIRAIQVATILIFTVIIAGVVLAVMRARNVTVPITHLAEAAEKLAQGDYDTQVDIRTGDELEQLGQIFNQTGPKLKAMEKMQRSLELARAIQQNLLPKTAPKLEGFELAGRCKYCEETGGDYYDFIELTEIAPATVGIALGDVTGHGVGAALLMAAARSILRSNAPGCRTDLAKLFEILNRHIESDTDYDKFITLFYGVLDANEKSLIWTSAGHDPAVWYHNRTGKIEELPNTGMPIGVTQEATFGKGGPVRLEAGDIVLVGTDGIWEAQNHRGDMFGKDRLWQIVTQNNNAAADEICSRVIDEVAHFCGPAPQLDDITLIVIRAI